MNDPARHRDYSMLLNTAATMEDVNGISNMFKNLNN